MRCLVLLVALVAVPVAGQPSAAADAALDPLLDALALERRAEAAFAVRDNPAAATALASVPADAVRDAVRARLAAGATPARLDSLAAAASDGRLAALTDRIAWASSAEVSSRIFGALTAPPKKGALPDSLEAARFVVDNGQAAFTRRLLAETFAALADRIPAAARELEATGRTIDAIVASQMADAIGAIGLADRLAGAEQPLHERRRAGAFAASDAGRWASAAVYDGLLDVYLPPLIEAAVASVGGEPAPELPEITDPLSDAELGVGGANVYDLVDQEPVMIGGLEGFAARLVYPEEARRSNVEGTVYVQFIVHHDGTPRHISVTRSPSVILSIAAIDALRATRFTPGRLGGRTVQVRYTLPVRFALQ